MNRDSITEPTRRCCKRKPSIDVCICTYKRPELLARLLKSVLEQDTHDLFDFSIVVVDNDARGSAEQVVRACANRDKVVVYDIEPEQNISLARNRALSNATGEFIAVIDDDEEALPLWLYHLFATSVTCQADVVFGPVLRYFQDEPPGYVVQSGAFVFPDPPTGSLEGYTWAGNALIRRSVLPNMVAPFDPKFGRTGGGDSNLYVDLRRRGHRLVWCSEARVREFVPPERANWRWILQRDFRVGNNTDRIHRRPAPPIRALSSEVFESLAKVFWSIQPVHFSKRPRTPAIKHLRRCARALGRVAYRIGLQYEEYTGRWYLVDRDAESSRVQRAAE